MLYVSDDLKPPKIVLSLFRHVIIKIPVRFNPILIRF